MKLIKLIGLEKINNIIYIILTNFLIIEKIYNYSKFIK